MHTGLISPTDFIRQIAVYLKQNGINPVFIATDDEDFIEILRTTYPYLNLVHQETERGKSGIAFGVHFNSGTSSDRIRRGYEIITDIYAMARSSCLLCGTSGIPTLAKIINPSLTVNKVVDLPWK